MSRYHLKCLRRELAYSIRHPRRFDWLELKYAIQCVWSDVAYPFKKPVWFLKSVWDWRMILWNDCDWDYGFMLEIWEHKFRNMHKHTVEHGCHVGSDRSAKQQLICAELCKRIHRDQYDDIPMRQHQERWGKCKLEFLPPDPNGNPHLGRIEISTPEAKTDAEKSLETYEILAISKHADNQRKQDIRYLGMMLEKYMLRWWE